MNDDVAQQIQDIYDTLPQNIKDVLSSEDTSKKLEAISKGHNLHIDQAAELSDLTSMVMLGIISSETFINDLKNQLHLSMPEAVALADEVNEQILRDIKATLEKVYADNNAASDEPEEDGGSPAEDYSNLHAHDILREIENPVSVIASTPAAFVAPRPAPTPIIKKTEPIKPLVESTGEDLIGPPPMPNLIEQKLTQTVRAPEPQKIQIASTQKPPSKLPPVVPKPLSNPSGVDAYREPIE